MNVIYVHLQTVPKDVYSTTIKNIFKLKKKNPHGLQNQSEIHVRNVLVGLCVLNQEHQVRYPGLEMQRESILLHK